MSRTIAPGAVDQSTVVRIVDSTDGTPETAVNEGTGGLALWYRREGGLKVTITPAALAALDSAHADGGIEAISDGYYRLDLPDAAVAAGVAGVAIGGTVTGMVIVGAYHQLETPQTGDSFARLGAPAGASVSADVAAVKVDTAAILVDTAEMQPKLPTNNFMGSSVKTDKDDELDAIKAKTDALPTDPADQSLIIAATDAVMSRLGAPAGASVSADVAAVKSDTAATLADTGTDGVVVAAASKTGYALSAAGIQAIWDALTSALTFAGSIGKLLVDNVNATIGSRSSHTAAQVIDEVVEGSVTVRQSLRLANSANGGKVAGAATTTVTVRDLADTKDRITGTVDASGNRTAVTRDLT